MNKGFIKPFIHFILYVPGNSVPIIQHLLIIPGIH